MKNNKQILLVENIHPVAEKILQEEGFAVTRIEHSPDEAELLKLANQYNAVGIRSKTQIHGDLLKKLSHLDMLGCFCIGTNQVDLGLSSELGIPVFNAPYSNTRSVAELVISEIVALSRNLCDASRDVHQGKWTKSAKGAHEVRGKTLGIVGYGHIGSQVSILAESFGMRVIFYDVIQKLPLGNARSVSDLKDLLKESDFVTLHVPDTELTKNLINAKNLSYFKTSAFLINASRGSVVDIEALASAIKNKKLAGVAIDVFPHEPQSNKEVFKSELQGLPNVILTPHIGGSTEEAQEAIGREVAYRFIQFYKSGSTEGAVDFPVLSVPNVKEGVIRMTNIHHNVPGVLGSINGIVSELGMNIIGQYLSTNSKVGYLVMDIQANSIQKLIEKVSSLKVSIKTKEITWS